MSDYISKSVADLRRGDFFWSDSLNRWLMATESPFEHTIRGTKLYRLQAITPAGDLTNVSEEGEPSSFGMLVNVHPTVPDAFMPDATEGRMERIRQQIANLTENTRQLAAVEVYASQALERAE